MSSDESRTSPEIPLETNYRLSQMVGRKAPEPSPDIVTTTAAAFRQSNLVGSIVSSHKLYEKATGHYYDIDRDFHPFASENLKGYEEYGDRFVDVFNKQAMDAVKADIDREKNDRKVLDRSGWVGDVMNIVASTLDAPTFLPGGWLAKGGKAGFSIARSVFSMGVDAAVSNGVQELGLHASQELRTVDESLVGIGGSVLAAGLIGTRRAAFLTPQEHAAAARAFDAVKAPDFDAETNALHAEMTAYSTPSPAADAAPRPAPSADLSVAGDAVPDVAKAPDATKTAATAPTTAEATAALNPLLRTLHSPSPTVREIGAQMMENPVYLTKTVPGKAEARAIAGERDAAGTSLSEFARGAVDKAAEAQRAAYLDARKAGLALTEQEFRSVVGRVMRGGDKSDIPGVAQAAEAWRSYVIEPLTKRAIDAGLLPKDVDPAAASAYFSRLWNREAIEAGEQEFKDGLRGYFDGQVSAAMAREAAEKQKTLSGLENAAPAPQPAAARDMASGTAGDTASGTASGKTGLSHLASHFVKHLGHFAAEQFETGFYKFAIGLAGDAAADAGPDQTGPDQTGKPDHRSNDQAAGATFQFPDDAARAAYVEGIVDDVYDRLTGRAADGLLPDDATLAAHGPLKGRSFDIPDALVEKFLDDDADRIGRRYARSMAGNIELAERFGSPSMTEAFERVRQDYAGLRQAGDDPAALERLGNRERADIADLQAVRDMLRGNDRLDIGNTSWRQVLAGAGAFDYMRAMGGALIGSLADAVRPTIVHGLSAYIRAGLAPMVRGVTAAGLGTQEAQLAGTIGEKILASRMASLAGITDPYAHGPVFARFLSNVSVSLPRMTGLMHWEDFQKTLASQIIQNRILANAEMAAKGGFASLPSGERAYMDLLGIGGQRAEELGRLFTANGETLDGVKLANTEAWGDDAISAATRRAYRAAINKDADSIVTGDAGGVPLFASTPVGRALQRFEFFALASNQSVLIRGLPEDKTRLAGGIVGMMTIGAFLYALKQLEAGHALPDDPATWATEGLDRSGIFAVGFEINNALEKLGVPGVYAGASALFPDASQKTPANRAAAGGPVGPTYELASDAFSLAGLALAKAKGAVTGNAPGMTGGDIATARRLIPFASLPYWRWLIDGILVQEAKRAVRD